MIKGTETVIGRGRAFMVLRDEADTGDVADTHPTGTSDPETVTPATGTADGNSVVQTDTKWFEKYSDDIKHNQNFHKYANEEAALRGLANAASLIGKDPATLIEKPNLGDPDSSRGALTQLGYLPEDEADYQLEKLEGAPDGFTTDGDLAKVFRDASFKHGVPTKAMNGVFKDVVDYISSIKQDTAAEVNEAADKHAQMLLERYGSALDQVDETATIVAEHFGVYEKLVRSGLASDPDILDMLVSAQSLVTEDGTTSRSAPPLQSPAALLAEADELTRAAIMEKNPAEQSRLANKAHAKRRLALAGQKR